MAGQDAPIGYWLKQVDRLIEAAFDRALAEDRLGRRHWQALNLLGSRPLDAAGLAEALRPFWSDGEITAEQVVGDLTGRGWITLGEDRRYVLTGPGAAARAATAARVRSLRDRMTDGLTEQEYAATINVLRRMAGNLQDAPGP